MPSRLIFLLGGHDLEMITIADILNKLGIKFYDENLKWDNANLSRYSKQVTEFGNNPEYLICGIELKNDLGSLPVNYKLIDHHGNNDKMPSSLEQVAEILGISLDRKHQLIAANDRGYIPEMEKYGATSQEIKSIRKEDREAQGVSEENEKAAKNAIAENMEDLGPLKIVKDAPEGAFSTICDILYPYASLLIYNDNSLCFYGESADFIRKLISTNDCFQQFGYFGGGKSGFCGLDLKEAPYNEREKEEHISEIKQTIRDYFTNNQSYHIFYFPFKWEFHGKERKCVKPKARPFSEEYDLAQLQDCEHRQWKRVCIGDEIPETEGKELFSERQYFFKFVHPALYDTGDSEGHNSIIYHYERLEPQQSGQVRYIIEKNDSSSDRKSYSLKVDAINLNFYSTGIGILSFYLKNDNKNQVKEEDIRNINQFGRRIMPPHSGEFDVGERHLLATKLQITGLDTTDEKRYMDSFDYAVSPETAQKGLNDIWIPSKIITSLIDDFSSKIRIEPVIDDRMLVNCWYGNTRLADMVRYADTEKTVRIDLQEKFKDIWYKQLFIDESDITCQNDNMRDGLLAKSTYFRWQKYGTLYGATKYSMLCLTDMAEFSTKTLSTHIRTIYNRLFELLILQKASVLRFSGEVTKVSNFRGREEEDMSIRISSLYKEYIRFVNQIYFRNVTIEDQGVELYELLSRQFNTEKEIKSLDDEINELNQYAAFLIDEKRNKNGERLNILAAIFLPPTLVAGILGMNTLSVSCTDITLNIIAFIASLLAIILIFRCYIKKK